MHFAQRPQIVGGSPNTLHDLSYAFCCCPLASRLVWWLNPVVPFLRVVFFITTIVRVV